MCVFFGAVYVCISRATWVRNRSSVGTVNWQEDHTQRWNVAIFAKAAQRRGSDADFEHESNVDNDRRCFDMTLFQ